MAHGKVQWSSSLPTILLGFRATWKGDLEATTAEMAYGAPIRLPGEFLSPTTDSPDPSSFVGKLKEVMQRLLPLKTPYHGQHSVFVSKDRAPAAMCFSGRTHSVRGFRLLMEVRFMCFTETKKFSRSTKIEKNSQ
ncbi:hypothetical protein AVEN_252268-1 [Araneus ventricosus]|uniref:Uncharacterized protein n=1 Tax=Araneus ventricosus TaxID=182803 RepID=A0A4Y2RFA5_ARAVE|nr:hypothetical protein AVEN_252268-1 [Araneus ventricosus]